MSMRQSKGRLWAVLISVCLATLLLAGAAGWAEQGDQPWTGQIRPGVMIGNSGNETDFFLDLLFPLWGDNKRLLFFNPHFRLGSHESNEQNAGIGYRGLYFDDRLILGANLFVDTMNSQESNRYNQAGMGLEILSQWVDLRANYYYPFSRRVNTIRDAYSFSGTGLFHYQHIEEAPRGFDGEIGLLVPLISDYVETRVAFGGYHYDSKVRDDINGTRTRVEVRPIPLLNLNAEFRDDDVGSATFIGGYLDIPFSFEALFSGKNPFEGIKKQVAFGKGARSLRERMTEKVVRDRHIRTFDYNPTEKVSDIIFVNQDNKNFGDGTYENPYHNVMSAPDDVRYKKGAWVYVFSWDKKADTYSNVHLALKDDMVLWGQGFYNPIYNLGGGPRPILDGGGYPTAELAAQNGYFTGSVVTLADNNEVMGLQIQNGGHGIYGSNIHTTNIHDNGILSNGAFGSGIHIENAFNGTDLTGLNLRYQITNNIIEDNVGSGIFLRTWVNGTSSVSDTNIETIIADNSVLRNTVDGIWSDTVVSAPEVRRVTITNGVTGNDAGENGLHGIHVDSFIGEALLPVADAALSPDGAAVTIDSVAINDDVSRNIVSGNADTGIFLTDVIGFSPLDNMAFSGVNVTIANAGISNILAGNTVEKNGEYGVDAFNAIGSGAFYPGASVSGMTALISNSGITNSFSGNNINNNARGGLLLENFIDIGADQPGASVTGLTAAIQDVAITNDLQQNLIKSNGGDGVFLENNVSIGPYLDLMGVASVDIVGMPVVSGSSAVITSAAISNTIRDNNFSDNSGNGLFLANELYVIMGAEGTELKVSGSQVTNTLSGNLLNTNGGSGLTLFSIVGSIGSQAAGGGEGTEASNAATALPVIVEDSGITNDLRENQADSNGVNGATMANLLGSIGFAQTEAVAAEVARSSIANTIKDNCFSNNGTPESGSILSGNGLVAVNVLGSAAATPLGTGQVKMAVSGEIGAAAIVDSSSISNDVSGNTASGNSSNGMIIGNVLGAALLDTNSPALNLLLTVMGEIIPAGLPVDGIATLLPSIPQAAVAAVDQVNGAGASLSGIVLASSIDNTFSGNTAEGNGANGMILGNALGVGLLDTNSPVADQLPALLLGFISGESNLGDIVGVSATTSQVIPANQPVVVQQNGTAAGLSGSVAGSIIENTFTGNTVKRNGADGVILGNALGVIAAADSWAVTGEVADSSISNTITSNTINRNKGDGLALSNALGIIIVSAGEAERVNLYATASGLVIGSGITNTLTDNEVLNNGKKSHGDGIRIMNEVGAFDIRGVSLANAISDTTATGNGGSGISLESRIDASSTTFGGSIADSTISITFNCNTINNNGDDGLWLNNWIDVSAGNESGNNQAGIISGSAITSAFNNNTVNNNSGDGVSLGSYLDASSWSNWGTSQGGNIIGSGVSTTLDGNIVESNAFNGVSLFQSIGAFALLGQGGSITRSSIATTLSDNNLSSNGFDGVSAIQKIDASVQIGEGGSITDSSIANTLVRNALNSNGSDGVRLSNILDAYVWALRSLDGSVLGSSITDTFTDNQVMKNGGGQGLRLRYDALDSVAVSLSMGGNKVKENAGDGLWLWYGGTNLDANLGDAATSTEGNNSFAGNGGFDLNNLTAQPIKAENNWWGQDTDPGAQISNPATVDYAPWLPVEP